MSYRFPLSYTPIDEQAIGTVLRRYAGVPHTELISDFEKEISRITGARYVAAVNSGTAAIHLALKALNVGIGDKVATSTFTYVASVNPVLYQGATPTLIDSESDTWNMDPELLETALKEHPVKAIVVVHGYGVPAKMDDILALSRKYNVPVIEDAAEALGSTYREKHVGTLGEIGVLSFNSNKIVTTYGGGALLTNDEGMYRRVIHWASQSRENKPYYEHLELGYNYRMSPLNAACGLAYLNMLPDLLEGRRGVLKQYHETLADTGDISFSPHAPKSSIPNHWLTTVLINSLEKKGLDIISIVEKLRNKGIETRPLWNPMHLQPLYSNMPFFHSGVSERLFRIGLCLPSGRELTGEDVSFISDALLEAVSVFSRH